MWTCNASGIRDPVSGSFGGPNSRDVSLVSRRTRGGGREGMGRVSGGGRPNYFGRHVVGGAAEGVGRPVQVDLQLAHAKVGDADVTFVVEEDVVQFQVPAHARRSSWILFAVM